MVVCGLSLRSLIRQAALKTSWQLFSILLCSAPSLWFHACIFRFVHSVMLFSHLFLCLPLLLPPGTVPCRMVLARPDDRVTWSYHISLRFLTIVMSSVDGPISLWICRLTSSFDVRSLYVMPRRYETSRIVTIPVLVVPANGRGDPESGRRPIRYAFPTCCHLH